MTEIFESMKGGEGQDSFRVIEELELNRPEEVREARGVMTTSIRAPLTVLPANACDRGAAPTVGVGREITPRTLFGVFQRPITVGSVFLLELDAPELGLGPVYAVCQKCSMLEGAFDATFAFLQDVDMSRRVDE